MSVEEAYLAILQCCDASQRFDAIAFAFQQLAAVLERLLDDDADTGNLCTGLLAVCCGLALSWYQDTPAGPSIVVSAAALFLASFALPKRNG